MCNLSLSDSWCLQSELSLQFDDLFKKAWEEDVTEFERDGMHDSHCFIFFCAYACKM